MCILHARHVAMYVEESEHGEFVMLCCSIPQEEICCSGSKHAMDVIPFVDGEYICRSVEKQPVKIGAGF